MALQTKEEIISHIKQEIEQLSHVNDVGVGAAMQIGYDVKKETQDALAKLDNRILVHIHQTKRISTLNSVLEDLQKS